MNNFKLFAKRLMVYFIHDRQQLYQENAASYKVLASYQYFLIWENKATVSATVSVLLSHYVSINSFFSKPFLLLFFSLFYLLTWSPHLLTCLSLLQSWNFCVIVNIVSKFLFFVLFRMLWKLVTANKLIQTAMVTQILQMRDHAFFWYLWLYRSA